MYIKKINILPVLVLILLSLYTSYTCITKGTILSWLNILSFILLAFNLPVYYFNTRLGYTLTYSLYVLSLFSLVNFLPFEAGGSVSLRSGEVFSVGIGMFHPIMFPVMIGVMLLDRKRVKRGLKHIWILLGK